MYRKSNVMYKVSDNQLIIYKLGIDDEVVNQCFEYCCNRYSGTHKIKKDLHDFEIEHIFNNGLCYNLVKTEVGSVKTSEENWKIYNIEYDKLETPYPTEVMVLDQIRNGNLIYLNQLFAYIYDHGDEKPFLKEIYSKIFENIEIEVLETLEFNDFTELIELLKTNKSINRELLYGLETIEKYQVSEQLTKKFKK